MARAANSFDHRSFDGRSFRGVSVVDIFGAISDGDAVDRVLSDDPGSARARNDDGISAVLWALYVGRPELARLLASKAGGRALDVYEVAALDRVDNLRRILD